MGRSKVSNYSDEDKVLSALIADLAAEEGVTVAEMEEQLWQQFQAHSANLSWHVRWRSAARRWWEYRLERGRR